MSNDMLGDRRKAMEEAFFARENEALRKRLMGMDDTRRKKEALSAASGITHDAVLEKLAALDIRSETLATLSLIPLVAVAWADGSIDDKERGAVSSRAVELGMGRAAAGRARGGGMDDDAAVLQQRREVRGLVESRHDIGDGRMVERRGLARGRDHRVPLAGHGLAEVAADEAGCAEDQQRRFHRGDCSSNCR